MLRTLNHRLIIVLIAVGAVSAIALGAHAHSGLPEGTVAVVAEPAGGGVQGGHGNGGTDGLVTVYLGEPGEGFSDGGDVPYGMVVALARLERNGFSDGGDVPEGFLAAYARLADGDAVPEGMIAVRVRPLDGAEHVPPGFAAVLLEPLDEDFSPPGG